MKEKKKAYVCREFGLVNSTIQKICKNGNKIIGAFEPSASIIKRFRKPERINVDKTLLKLFNPLAANDVYIRLTTQLTSRRCILYIYSTNILTEYFKHAAHSPFFYIQDAVYFIMLPFLVPVVFTF